MRGIWEPLTSILSPPSRGEARKVSSVVEGIWSRARKKVSLSPNKEHARERVVARGAVSCRRTHRFSGEQSAHLHRGQSRRHVLLAGPKNLFSPALYSHLFRRPQRRNRHFSFLSNLLSALERSRPYKIGKRCSIAGAAKALSNASTGSSRLCRRRLKKSFGCRLRNFLHLKFGKAERKRQRSWTGISKQRRGNRDHYGRRTLFP